jgi:hypothetical protein
MAKKPYYTSNTLIEAVKRKMAMPISQVAFSDADILAFADEEMFLAQVPSILQYHEEYLVYEQIVPMVPKQSKYPIPNRAIGMKIRDLFYRDVAGQLVQMSRINPDDRSFFEVNSNTTPIPIHYYVQNNQIVITPAVTQNATGNLIFTYYMRPNSLVTDDQAAICEKFSKDITVIDSSSIVQTEVQTITFSEIPTVGRFNLKYNGIQTAPIFWNEYSSDIETIIRAIPALSNAVVTGSIELNNLTITFPAGDGDLNQILPGSINELYTSDCLTYANFASFPVEGINGSIYVALDTNISYTWSRNQYIQVQSSLIEIKTATEDRTTIKIDDYSLQAGIDFSVGVTDSQTAINLAAAISALNPLEIETILNSNIITVFYKDRNTVVTSNTPNAIGVESTITMHIPNGSVIPDSIVPGGMVDILQADGGHSTLNFDVVLQSSVISNTSLTFNESDLPADFVVGDYVCAQYQCIIPQVPTDLHNLLAERTCARILESLGDKDGLQAANLKINELEQRQATIIDSRVEGSPLKVLNRSGLLRSSRIRFGRRG